MHLKTDLLLLHGALGAASQFDRLKAKLSSHFNLYTFDFTGHGTRSSDQDLLSIKLFSDQLKAFVADHGLEGCDVFGYSMGGYVALHAAADDQELFRKIVTLGTKYHWNPETSAKEASMLHPGKIKEKVPAYAQFLEALHGEHWTAVLERTASMMKNLGSNPELSIEQLGRITNQVLVGVGDKDKMVTQNESRELSAAIKNSGFSVLPFTPHPLEQADERLIETMIHYFLAG